MKKLLFLIFSIVLLSSCLKEEEPVRLPEPEGTKHSFDVGNGYDNRIYVSLENGEQLNMDNKTWDLAFTCNPNGWDILLNGGNNALIAKTEYTDFLPTIDPTQLNWRWDAACGSSDSLALSNWCYADGMGTGNVYVMDRGDAFARDKRYVQFILYGVNHYYYILITPNAEGTGYLMHQIDKNPSKNHVYFSFENSGQVLDFEPTLDNWDLCFTPYRWVYFQFNPPLLYNVAGVFTNNHFISVAVDSSGSIPFNQITTTDFNKFTYSHNRDAIGFDWKVPQFTPTGVIYRTRSYVTYLIKRHIPGHAMQLYKLRFIDFYDGRGNKGKPVYELVRLQ